MRPAALATLLVLSFALAAAHAPDRAAAASFEVTSGLPDAVDAAPGDGVCATAGGRCTLRAAVQEANALPGPDTITIPGPQPFLITLAIEGRDEDAAATGDLDIIGPLTIENQHQFDSIISGAGIDRVFDVRPGAQVTIRGLDILDGAAGDGDGGAVRNQGMLALEQVSLAHNSADDGGAINNDGTLTLVEAQVLHNAASDVGGGINNYGTLTLRDVTIDANDGPFGGGGVNNFGTLTVLSSAVTSNTSATGRGAGVNNFGTAGIVNTTISGNSAHQSGAGIANSGDALALTNVTIAENVSDALGGGLFNNAPVAVMRNTLLSANAGANCDLAQALQDEHHNLEAGSSCSLAGPGDREVDDALIGPLRGGVHELLPGSPAIDAGDNVSCFAPDQIGTQRPLDGDGDGSAVCDVGAVEWLPLRPGDVDCNHGVTAIDATLVLQWVAGLLHDLICASNADANGDGARNAVDAAVILQYVAGLLPSLPP